MKEELTREVVEAMARIVNQARLNEEVAMFNCPQCGEETETLNEGYCEECRDERQSALNEHNARFDFWEKCTDAEKDFYIRSASGI